LKGKMKNNKALLYEVVYDLPYHKNNIATVEAVSREAAEEKVQGYRRSSLS